MAIPADYIHDQAVKQSSLHFDQDLVTLGLLSSLHYNMTRLCYTIAKTSIAIIKFALHTFTKKNISGNRNFAYPTHHTKIMIL